MDNAAITAVARRQLEQALPATAKARLVRTVVVREHRATFSLAPGGPPRPQAVTPLRGFYLAGDWTDTGLPGTIDYACGPEPRPAAIGGLHTPSLRASSVAKSRCSPEVSAAPTGLWQCPQLMSR